MFTDRKEAGMLLAKQLERYKNDKNALVLAIPRGGIIPANEISKTLNLPLEIILVKKIGANGNKEFAIGAVSLEDYILTSKLHKDKLYLESEIQRLRKIIRTTDLFFRKSKATRTGREKGYYCRRWSCHWYNLRIGYCDCTAKKSGSNNCCCACCCCRCSS